MAFINRNIELSSELKFWPGVVFSPDVEQYVNTLADFYSVHPDSLAIILLNITASTLEFSQVLRANCSEKPIPTNLFNIIIARSSYGKSELTKICRQMLKTVAKHRPNKFRSTDQIVTDYQINPFIDEMSKAGLLNALSNCCRIVISDEADMSFAENGIFYSLMTSRCNIEMNCRGLVMALYDRISQPYVKQLANRTITVERSRLNMLGCSTGDLIANMVIRIKSELLFDSAIGRFLFWPLGGPVILDTIEQKKINFFVMPSLEQFCVVLSLVENVVFTFEKDALEEIVSWGNECKRKSDDTKNINQNLAACIGKSVQHVYRIVSFLQAIEICFFICAKYLRKFNQFPLDGVIDNVFIHDIEFLYHAFFPDQFAADDAEPFLITKDVTKRGINLISCNMRQFLLLFDDRYAPKLSSIGRQMIVVSSHPHQCGTVAELPRRNDVAKEDEEQEQNILNFKRIATEVILFPSICFTMNQLHNSSTFIHNHSSGGLLKEVLKELVHVDVLMECPRGIKHSSRTTKVFIKRIPLENDNDEKEFLSILSDYPLENKPITIDMYRKSCESIKLDAVGVVQDDIYELLRREEYGNRDLSILTLLPKIGRNKKCASTISIFENDNDSILPGDIDPNVYLNFEQDVDLISGEMRIEENHQLPIEENIQQINNGNENMSLSDSVLPKKVNTDSFSGNIDNDKTVDQTNVFTEVSDERISVSSIDKKKEQNLNMRKINASTPDESTSVITSENEEQVLANDGFVSPTSWKTRSRNKENNVLICQKQVVASSLLGTECQNDASPANIFSSPPSRRTRAQIKRKGAIDVVKHKKKKNYKEK